jgi:hypothetical protein
MKRIALVVTLALARYWSNAGTAGAHAGHSHEGSGSGFGALEQLAVAAVAVALVYLLASIWFRYRDRG